MRNLITMALLMLALGGCGRDDDETPDEDKMTSVAIAPLESVVNSCTVAHGQARDVCQRARWQCVLSTASRPVENLAPCITNLRTCIDGAGSIAALCHNGKADGATPRLNCMKTCEKAALNREVECLLNDCAAGLRSTYVTERATCENACPI